MRYRTVESSLSFPPIVKNWPTKRAAINEYASVMVAAGWKADAAVSAARKQVYAIADGPSERVVYVDDFE